MEKHQQGNKNRWDRLRKNYHLILRNEDTFEEVYNIRLNLLNVYIILCTVIFVVALAVFLMIAYTPLKTYLPGYGDLESNRAYVKMLNRVNTLESQLESQQIYIENFRRMITQDVQYEESFHPDSLINRGNQEVLGRIPEDEELRKSVELENRLSVSQSDLSADGDNNLSYDQVALIPPVEGLVMMKFDPEQRHFGIDVAAPEKSPVKAVLNGYVISAGWNIETGHTMAIQHENNMVSFYKHNASLLKKTGDYVGAGEVVAIAGNTGKHTDGPHLHFEIWLNGKPVDPARYIRFTSNK